VQPLPVPSNSMNTWSEELIRLQQQNGELITQLNAEGALRNTIQHEAQKLFPEISRINSENMDLFQRLTASSAALGEAKLYSDKGWALWQKVCTEKQEIQRELDAMREKIEKRDRQDRLDGVQAGIHHDNIKKSVARMENEKAAKEVELEEARNSEANMKSALDGKVREARELK